MGNHLRELVDAIDKNEIFISLEREDDPVVEYEQKDCRQSMIAVSSRSEECVCFDIGSVEIVESIRFEHDLFMLPYPVCYFEAFMHDSGFGGEGLISVTVFEKDSSSFDMHIFCRRRHQWTFWMAGEIKKNVEISGKKYLTVAHVSANPIKDHQGFSEYVEIVGCFLSALNCSNIRRIENKQPEKLQKARASRGKKPLFSYWTLELKQERTEGDPLGGTHAAPRLHLRRGHPRQYAEGKWTWVQPCVVGNKAAGMVHKDYRLAA